VPVYGRVNARPPGFEVRENPADLAV